MKSGDGAALLRAYGRLLAERSLRMHETDATFELVPSLIARAERDGFAARTDHLVFGDTVWDTEEVVELIGLTDTERWPSAAVGWDAAIAEAQERLQRDWEVALGRGQADHSDAERQAHLELIAELLKDAEAVADRLHTPTPSMLTLKPGERLIHPIEADYEHWSREDKEGRLPPEAWQITMNTLSSDLHVFAELGGPALPACEALTRVHWREPAERKRSAIRAAQSEVGISPPAERRREPQRWFGFGACPFAA